MPLPPLSVLAPLLAKELAVDIVELPRPDEFGDDEAPPPPPPNVLANEFSLELVHRLPVCFCVAVRVGEKKYIFFRVVAV